MNLTERIRNGMRRILPVRAGNADPQKAEPAQPDDTIYLKREDLAEILSRYSSFALAERMATLGLSEQEQNRRIAELEARISHLELIISRCLKGLACTALILLFVTGFYFAHYLR